MQHKSRRMIHLLISLALLIFTTSSFALFISPPKEPLPLIKSSFPSDAVISSKVALIKTKNLKSSDESLLPVWTITQQDKILGYAFETNDIARIAAYSGEPVNMLVIMDTKGVFIDAKVLEHHEPILLTGIPETKLWDFAKQYIGHNVAEKIKVGGNANADTIEIDGLSGATVTVMVVNTAIMRSAKKVAEQLGIIKVEKGSYQPISTIKADLFKKSSWNTLTGDGSIRKLFLDRKTVDEAFSDTIAAHIDEATEDEKEDMFSEIYYTLLDVPTIGKSLLSEKDYKWLTDNLKPGEHLLGVFGNGYSYKGSGYVRGGIFDRIQIQQGEENISFRDLGYNRITDLALSDVPRFREMSAFIIRAHHDFDPGADWELELLVRRQTGPVDSVFTAFKSNYSIPAQYVITPAMVQLPPELTLIQTIWQEQTLEVSVLLFMIFILFLVLVFQDTLAKHPRFLSNLHRTYLAATVILIGWVWGGQLSVVNVFTFLHALLNHFSWDLFLLNPALFILWSTAAVVILLFGRAIYCGWLCPFGALQELLNIFARYIKIPQFEFPFAVHERLWAIKYLILLGLFGLSLQSVALAEQFAEIEPFKTTFLLYFNREWPFVTWAVFLLFINLFQRKTFCRYICPLGAALSISTNIRLFDWLKRRDECGKPCNTCAKECEIGAIMPSGEINMRECHYCLDCQVTYFDDKKCPPLKKIAYKKSKSIPVVSH